MNPTVTLPHPVDGVTDVPPTSWDGVGGVAGVVWSAPRPRAAVLFQHGWNDPTARWAQQAGGVFGHLLAAGCSVYAVDMRGTGASPGPRGLTDADVAVTDHLAARARITDGPDGARPLFLLGHSLGALVTVSSALDDDRGLAGVVLLAAAVRYDVPRALLAVGDLARRIAPGAPVPGLGRGTDHNALTRDPTAVRALRAWDAGARLPLTTAVTGGRLAAGNWARYGSLRVPLLAVHGTADTITDPDGSRALVDAVGSPDATWIPVAGARHALLDDLDADTVRRRVVGWIEDRLGPVRPAGPPSSGGS